MLTLGDLHKSLFQLLDKDIHSMDMYKDIFKEVLPENRSCDDVGIDKNYCHCHI